MESFCVEVVMNIGFEISTGHLQDLARAFQLLITAFGAIALQGNILITHISFHTRRDQQCSQYSVPGAT